MKKNKTEPFQAERIRIAIYIAAACHFQFPLMNYTNIYLKNIFVTTDTVSTFEIIWYFQQRFLNK